MTVPMIAEAIVGNIEYTVFTIFAAHQGVAEAATWILLSYVWSAVGIAPGSFGSASSCHVERLISTGEIEVAKLVSMQAIKVGTVISTCCSLLLFLFRKQFVWCFSLDETLDQMLLETIPYITMCQPFMTIGWTAQSLNDALHLYKRAMVSNALVTVLIMVPCGYVMTYVLHYNIEGLASSQCIGYTATGVINIVFFLNADWEKAERKAKDISNVDFDTGAIVGKYDDCGWEDLSKEAKAAAESLGYDKDKWDNGKATKFQNFDLFTEEQNAAADLMGYTRAAWNRIRFAQTESHDMV